jgi:hypothetical protein
MIAEVTRAAEQGTSVPTLQDRLSQLAAQSYITADKVRRALVVGWGRAAGDLIQRGILSEDAERRLLTFSSSLSLTQADLDVVDGSWSRLVKAAIIREVTEGKLPSRFKLNGPPPFNLVKSEQIVWAFSGCQYYEDRIHRTRVGGYQGISVRVVKGVYYHVGGFHGRSVETHSMDKIDTGVMGITNKNIYFAGKVKIFRVPYAKVVSFDAYSDGIGIHRDAASARAQVFVTGDGWFTYNLVANLAKLAVV